MLFSFGGKDRELLYNKFVDTDNLYVVENGRNVKKNISFHIVRALLLCTFVKKYNPYLLYRISFARYMS